MDDPITLFVIAGAGCFGGIDTLRVVRSVELTAIQKVVLIALAWIIPLIAAIIVMILTERAYMRRLFLVLINLSPWIVGTWRKEFSTRETFLARGVLCGSCLDWPLRRAMS